MFSVRYELNLDVSCEFFGMLNKYLYVNTNCRPRENSMGDESNEYAEFVDRC